MKSSDKRIETRYSFWISAFLLPSSNSSYSFPWQARVGFHCCQQLPPILAVKTNAHTLCHSAANHRFGSLPYRNRITLLRLSLTPSRLQVWSTSQSFNHWILLRIPQTRFRPSGFSWMPPSGPAYTTKTLISRNGWLVCQASTRLSGDQPCIVQSGIQEIFTKPQMLVEQEWLSVTLFMSENGDGRQSSPSSSWRTSDILDKEQAELNGRTIVIALILEVQQSSTP